MGRITLTEQDVKRGTLLEPAWYLCEIIDYSEKESREDKSMNYIVDLKVVDNNPEVNGVPIRRYFNEKRNDLSKPFIECFISGKAEVGKSYELSRDLIGKQLNVLVARGNWNQGKASNDAVDFAPKGAPVR
jgi:hypothetical protein